MKSVIIVDDHSLFSNALQILINQFDDFSVDTCCQNGKELIFRLQNTSLKLPDIILLDINMPVMNGLETMEWLSKHHPSIPILALTMQADENIILEMLKKGVKGYLLKDSSPSLLKKALDDTLSFGFFHTESVTKTLLNAIINKPLAVDLKDKEIQFLKLACTEKTYKEIAQEMHLSPKTIDGYRESLFEKLDVKSRVGLVIFAIKNKIAFL
ncbi:MAG: response regulator transcription factor [Saprospiraceae bacterium]|nr:response regulator transcription factor [Saprospiraceae bacterium]